jgi:shikimate kinase
VAPLLAARLGLPWRALDREIERTAGRTIADLLGGDGEESFRAREHAALRAALDAAEALVIDCGGGVVSHAASRAALRAGAAVVWLRVTPETAAARLGRAGLAARPLLAAAMAGTAPGADAGKGALRALLAARAVLYEAASDVVVETEGRDPAAVADAAASALRERWASFES